MRKCPRWKMGWGVRRRWWGSCHMADAVATWHALNFIWFCKNLISTRNSCQRVTATATITTTAATTTGKATTWSKITTTTTGGTTAATITATQLHQHGRRQFLNVCVEQREMNEPASATESERERETERKRETETEWVSEWVSDMDWLESSVCWGNFAFCLNYCLH